MNLSYKNTYTQYAIACLIIFGTIFLFFHSLFFGSVIATNDISTSDLLYYNLPNRTLYSDALRQGELLLWTPTVYGGFPVMAEGQGGFLYPVNLVLWYLLSPIAAMNFYIIFHAFFMGLGVYLLVSMLTGNKVLSIPSAAAAAVCGSIIAGHTRHLNSLSTIVFIPWLFYSIELYLKTKKNSKGLLLGVLMGLMFLSGHPQFSFIAGFFAFLYLILRILFEKKQKNNTGKQNLSFLQRIKSLKLIYFLLLSLIILAIIIFPQIKSTSELIPFTERGESLNPEFTGKGSLPIQGFLTFIYPYYLGNAGDATFKLQDFYLFWEFFHYTSVIIFALAIYGTIKMWNRTEYRSVILSFFIIAILGYLLATGENLYVYKIFSFFPFTKSFRFPCRWLVGTEFAILVLSGFGVISLFEMIFKKGKLHRDGEMTGKKKAKTPDNLNKAYNLKLSNEYAAAFIISFIVVLEIYIVAGRQVATADPSIYLNPPSYVNQIKENNKTEINSKIFSMGGQFLVNAYLKSHGWEGKQDLFGLGAKFLPDELGVYFGVPVINGYYALVPSYIYSVWGGADKSGIISKTASVIQNKVFQPTEKFVKLSKLFGVKYLTTYYDVQKPYVKIWDSLGVKVYQLPDTLSKCWVISKVESFQSNSNEINAEKLINDNFDPWKSAYVDGPSPILPLESQNGKAEILKYENHAVTIKAGSAGFVVLNDTWYPRWKAYIDGNEVPIYKTNVMMRGVVAPKAGTIIEMKFDDGHILEYSLISYLAIVGSLIFSFSIRRKKTRGL